MSYWTGRESGVRSVARWVRLITVLCILLQMLLVPASQAQQEGGLVQEVGGHIELAANGFNGDSSSAGMGG